MHHRNHNNSTSNHSNPAHYKPKYPSSPAPTNEKRSVLSRFKEKFQEKPATASEIQQLRLNTVREELKTRKVLAKNKRPSHFSFGGGFQPAPASYRRSSPRATPQSGSWLLSENSGLGYSFFGNTSGPSLDFITGGGQKPQGKRSSKSQRSGLDELFT